jgi:DNA helicase-2/ATP-dependent DNA helicase PcrA
MIKPRFVVGPPGTGKTHTFLLEKYREFFKKYDPDKIILISHTNVAVQQILNAAMDVPEIRERGYRRKFFEDRICTIHHYCKRKLDRREVFTEQDNEDFKNLCRMHVAFTYGKTGDDPYKNHPFFKFIKAAYGHDHTLEEHWHHPNTDRLDYNPYHLTQLQELKTVYEQYKKDNNLYDFGDMITEYNRRSDLPEKHKGKIRSDIEVLMVDEAQDTNRPQLRAVFNMAKNIKDEHFYMIGDPDQTIFEWAGSDAKYFHEAGAKPWLELTQGKRCGEAINKYCKQIIAPIWKDYEYEGGGRVWLPAPGIQGNIYHLADLNPSLGLKRLLEKIKNTQQTFIFAYRGKPSDKRIKEFFETYGIEYAHITSSAHVPLKELKCHDEWPSFTEGAPKNLKQIKHFWDYLGSKAIVFGKGLYKFEDWVNKDYTIDELIQLKLLKPDAKKIKFFDLLRKRANGCDFKQHEKRMFYIRKVIKNGFDFNGKIRVKYGNIHKIKGTTFDNVVGDLSIFRRGKREHPHIELRLQYTMFSRGIYDAWILKSETGRSLGEYGRIR